MIHPFISPLMQKIPCQVKFSKYINLFNVADQILQSIQLTKVNVICCVLFILVFIADESVKSSQQIGVQDYAA